jgi:hypothetical protein
MESPLIINGEFLGYEHKSQIVYDDHIIPQHIFVISILLSLDIMNGDIVKVMRVRISPIEYEFVYTVYGHIFTFGFISDTWSDLVEWKADQFTYLIRYYPTVEFVDVI